MTTFKENLKHLAWYKLTLQVSAFQYFMGRLSLRSINGKSIRFISHNIVLFAFQYNLRTPDSRRSLMSIILTPLKCLYLNPHKTPTKTRLNFTVNLWSNFMTHINIASGFSTQLSLSLWFGRLVWKQLVLLLYCNKLQRLLSLMMAIK